MKKILVTGGEGYIGRNLTNFLYIYGCGNISIDISDYNTSKLPAHKIKDIKKYDFIVHLAALSGIISCEEKPVEAVKDNILSAQNIFKLAYEENIPTIFTSSQAIKNPSSSIYAYMKWTCEKIAEYYNDLCGSNYVIRLSNVYGGDHYLERKNTVVKQFITQYREKKPLEVHGNGKQIRDFVHVHDVCRAIMNIIERKPLNKFPMDIGTGKGISIMDLVNMFPKRKNHYKLIKSRSAGTDSSISDITNAKYRIGFEATKSLEQYIKSMI